MTTNELKNWMRNQLEQGNSIPVVSEGQGGSGYALTNNEAIIADVDSYETIAVVNDNAELATLTSEMAGVDDLSNYESVVKLSNTEGEVLYILTDITSEQLLEQALIDYAINAASSEDVAQVLNVDADAIQSALVDFAEEWNDADEPSEADEVIDKWVARLKEVEHYYIGYAINMHEGDSECYVCTPQDIEDETGSCEPDENYLFPTRTEAEKAIKELQEYTREKGYKLTFEIAPIEDLGEVEDVELTKGGYGHDTLTWSYMGKSYECTGEFFIDKDNKLHHTFVAPSGKEVEIVTPYE